MLGFGVNGRFSWRLVILTVDKAVTLRVGRFDDSLNGQFGDGLPDFGAGILFVAEYGTWAIPPISGLA